MSEPGIVFLFPAFPSDYKEDVSQLIPGYAELFKVYLRKASDWVDSALSFFDPGIHNFLDNELHNQYIAYIQSCTCSYLLRSKGLNPGILAYYSMGIYASLVDSGSITFETGLDLIKNAYREIRIILKDSDFSMCSIIGLNVDDIRQLISRTDPETEISNQNGKFSFVLSGQLSSIKLIVTQAREEGAIHTSLLDVKEPYHSRFLRETQFGFSKFIGKIQVSDPVTPILSSINQTQLNSTGQIKSELVKNLYHPFNWYQTHINLIDRGYKLFIECSPLPSLIKIARFLPGEARYISPLSALNSPLFPDS